MFAGLGTRVRTFWQDQRAAFARLVARDPSINREATAITEARRAIHHSVVFRRERDEALAALEQERHQRQLVEAAYRDALSFPPQVVIGSPLLAENPYDDWQRQRAAAVEFNNLYEGSTFIRNTRRRPTTYTGPEQEDL